MVFDPTVEELKGTSSWGWGGDAKGNETVQPRGQSERWAGANYKRWIKVNVSQPTK